MAEGEPVSAPSTSRPSRIRLTALAAAIVLVGASGGLVVWLREPPAAVSVDAAVSSFRGGARPSWSAARTAPTPSSSAPAPPATDPPPSAPAAPAEVTPTGTTPAVAPAPSPSSPPMGSRWPDEGVYTFRTSGGEETDALGGARHEYPEEVPLVVRRGGCGYTMRWQPLDGRWDEWEFCADGPARHMARITTHHEFFQRAQRQDFACDHPDMLPPRRDPGHRFTWTCRNEAGSAEATTTVVGVETLSLADGPVEAVRYRHDVVFRGVNEGTQVYEWWLHTETGLPVKFDRDLRVTSRSPFGRVAYRERFRSTAVSLTPRR